MWPARLVPSREWACCEDPQLKIGVLSVTTQNRTRAGVREAFFKEVLTLSCNYAV